MKNLNWLSDLNSKLMAALAVASFLFSPFVHSVTFQVSTSDEFQAALTTAASNGGDDEIVLAAGTYPGNFKFISEESAALVIRAADGLSEGEVVLDGEYRAFVFRFDARDFESSLTIRGLTLTKAKSEVNGGALLAKGSGGELVLEDSALEKNFALGSPGMEAEGWNSIVLRRNRFSDNGKYINPSSSDQGPGGAEAAHANLSAIRILVEQTEFASVSANYDPSTMDSFDSSFRNAVSLAASNNNLGFVDGNEELDCDREEIPRVDFRDNTIKNIGSVGRDGSQLLFTVDRFVNASAVCVNVENNEITNLESNYGFGNLYGSILNFSNNLIEDYRSSYKAVFGINYGGSYVEASRIDFIDNRIFNISKLFDYSSDYFIELTGPGTFSGNDIRQSDQGIEIKALSEDFFGDALPDTVLVQDNVFASVGAKCGLRVSSNDTQVINNSFYRTEASGLCLDASDDSEMLVANNIAWASPEATSGLDIDRIGYGLKSTLVNNIFLSASELWDVEEGNSSLDPRFFDPESGDLHVTNDSPAINAGSNDYALGNTNDLDGNVRVLDGTVDIGAYERNTTDLHPADTNGDSVISSAEFEAYNTAWRANDVWPTAPAIITADFVTRAGYLLQKGGAYKNIGVGKPATWVPADE